MVLGHNALYTAVGPVWLSVVDNGSAEDQATIRLSDGSDAYQVALLRKTPSALPEEFIVTSRKVRS